MAGVHGKNAELRISTAETRVGPVALVAHSNAALAAAGVFSAPDENLKFAARGEADAAIFTYIAGAPLTVKELDANSRDIHYATGSVRIPPADFPTLVSGSVSGTYTSLTLETVANLACEDREFELNIEADIIDATTLCENFKTFVEGIQEWSGSLDGLYRDPDRYKLAVADASGIIPKKILRLKPRPDKDTYFQGTAFFPTYGLTGGFDSLVERTVDFTGQGPIELVEDGLPFFPGV